MVDQWLALLPYRQKVSGLNPDWGFSVWKQTGERSTEYVDIDTWWLDEMTELKGKNKSDEGSWSTWRESMHVLREYANSSQKDLKSQDSNPETSYWKTVVLATPPLCNRYFKNNFHFFVKSVRDFLKGINVLKILSKSSLRPM